MGHVSVAFISNTDRSKKKKGDAQIGDKGNKEAKKEARKQGSKEARNQGIKASKIQGTTATRKEHAHGLPAVRTEDQMRCTIVQLS